MWRRTEGSIGLKLINFKKYRHLVMKNRDSQFTRIEKSNLPYTNPYTQDLKSEKITLEDNQFCLQLRKNLIR